MSYDLGIDVGTSFTAAAVKRGRNVEVLGLGAVGDSVPTTIYLRADGLEVIGEAANRRGLTDPARVARGFKRRLGDPQPIILGGAPYSPQALFAKTLRWVVDAATERHGGGPLRVAASHPANWGPYKLELFEQALQLADLEGAALISEPHAAALSYASREQLAEGSVVAVYDLGGGTFDAAILQKHDDDFELLGQSVGIEHLGGMDFDEAVINHVVTRLGTAWPSDDLDDPAIMQNLANLRRSCVEAKEALSTDEVASIPVLLPGVGENVEISRSDFEASIRPKVEDTIHALHRAVSGSGVGVQQISQVLLVGGSSRIPLIAQMVSAELGRPVAIDTDPKFPIAKGAALAAEPLGGYLAYPIHTPTSQIETADAIQSPPDNQVSEPVPPQQAVAPAAPAPATASQDAPPTAPAVQPAATQNTGPLGVPDHLPSEPTGIGAPAAASPPSQPPPQSHPQPLHPQPGAGHPQPPADDGRSNQKLPILAGVAAVVAVLAGGFLLLSNFGGGGDGDSSAQVAGANDTGETKDSDGLVLSGDEVAASTGGPAVATLPSPESMVSVPAGTYTIGLDGAADHAASRLETSVEFYIDQFEVTNAQYAAFVEKTGVAAPSDWNANQPPVGEEDFPVDGVRVLEAESFCQALGKRLPTEAEWEIAARGPAALLYPWGDEQGAVELPNSGTYPVGSVPANTSAFEVFDLAGNVWEWVGDPYEPIDDGQRMLRGGENGLVRDSAYRLVGNPDTATLVASAGFRCAANETDPSTTPFDFSNATVQVLGSSQTPTVSTGPLGELLFEDDFADPSSGWPDEETDNKLAGYHPPDFYHLQSSAPSNWVASTRGVLYGDVAVATDVQVDNTGSTDGIFRYGLVVRASGEGFVAFAISPRTGEWFVLQADLNQAGTLVVAERARGLAPSVTGFSSNDSLRVDAEGDEFTFSVNNQVLAHRVPLEVAASGDIGFYVETFESESKAHVHFDQIAVRELS